MAARSAPCLMGCTTDMPREGQIARDRLVTCAAPAPRHPSFHPHHYGISSASTSVSPSKVLSEILRQGSVLDIAGARTAVHARSHARPTLRHSGTALPEQSTGAGGLGFGECDFSRVPSHHETFFAVKRKTMNIVLCTSVQLMTDEHL